MQQLESFLCCLKLQNLQKLQRNSLNQFMKRKVNHISYSTKVKKNVHVLQNCDVVIVTFQLAPSKKEAEARKEKVKSLLKKKGSLLLPPACRP